MAKKAINETTAHIGSALRAARQTAHLSHIDVADMLDITLDDLLEYERGSAQVPIAVLERVFTMGYKMIGIRVLEKKYKAQRNFIRKIKQTIKESA